MGIFKGQRDSVGLFSVACEVVESGSRRGRGYSYGGGGISHLLLLCEREMTL